MFFNILILAAGCLSVCYDFILIALNPGTFLDILTSFTHIWLVLGAYLIFVSIYRIKTGHSFFKIWKKWMKAVFIAAAGLCAVIAIVNLIFINTPKLCEEDYNADYLILLGGGIDKDGKLPGLVGNRVKVAADYLNEHKLTDCIVTGGTLKWLPYAEGPAIKQALIDAGVAANRIIVEDKALDTIQNLELSCKLICLTEEKQTEEVLNSKVLLVSNKFHLRRAERIARRLGYTQVRGLKAKTPLINVLHSYVKEICSYIKLNCRILFTGKPAAIN